MLYASGVDLSVFDLSLAPTVITVPSSTSDYMAGSAVVGSIGYLARMGGGLVVEDLRDPTHPAVLSRTGDSAVDIAVSGHYAYVASETGGAAQLLVYDVSNPSAPVPAGQATASGQYIENLRLVGGRAYAMCDIGYLCVFDVTSPTAPVRVAVADISSVIPVASIQTPFDVSGNDLFVPVEGKLYVVDVSNLAALKTVTSSPITGAYGDEASVVLSGTTLYLAGSATSSGDANQYLMTIDVSNPSAPKVLATAASPILFGSDLYDTQGWQPSYWQLNVDGRWALLSERWGGLVVFDVSNPAKPVVANDYWTVDPADYAFVKDRFLTTFTVTTFNYPATSPAAADQVIAMCQ